MVRRLHSALTPKASGRTLRRPRPSTGGPFLVANDSPAHTAARRCPCAGAHARATSTGTCDPRPAKAPPSPPNWASPCAEAPSAPPGSPASATPSVRQPGRRLRAALPRRSVQLGRHVAADGLRLLRPRPLRLRPLRHHAAPHQLRRPRARATGFAAVAQARRPRLLLRREPRRHLRRQRPLHRSSAQRSRSPNLHDARLGRRRVLQRAPPERRLVAPAGYFIFSAMAVSSFQAIAELLSTSGRKSHGVMPEQTMSVRAVSVAVRGESLM